MLEANYDVLIIGGGAAGLTAGLYACRAGLKTVLLERLMPGGQVVNAEKIENYPGFPDGISGAQFGPLLHDQASRYGLETQLSEVKGLHQRVGAHSPFDSAQGRRAPQWAVETYEGEFVSKAVIIAGGSTLRKLGVPGEDELRGAGVSYCATCDGSFFMDQVVGVVGGGDSALDEALVLTEFASKVVIFHRRDRFRGQKVLQDRALSNPRIEVRWNSTITAILGDRQVEGVSLRDTATGETSRADLAGVFIYVGLDPNTQYLRGLLELDNSGHVPTDIWMRTALPGLFAAGDIRQSSAAQLVSAAGDGATAAIAAQRYIEGREGPS
jgi:thioredoxin reductase (NADPH)